MPAGASVHIVAECIGPQLRLFINNELVAEAYDTRYGEGDVGLEYDSLGSEFGYNHHVLVDYFRVYAP